MSNYQIDQIDQKILSFLVKNARMPFLEIARECNVSGAAIHQRVKRLEANGVITGSRLLVKPQALGLNVCAYVSVSLSEANKYPDVIESFKKISEIVECHFVTGKHALLIKLYCFDHDHLMQVLLNTIQKIPYVQQTETQISLDQAIERQVWVKEYQNTSFSASVKKKKKEQKQSYLEEKDIIAMARTRSSWVVIFILNLSPIVKERFFPFFSTTEASSVNAVS